MLTAMHRLEARLNKRIDALEANTKRDLVDSEACTRAEIVAVEVRTTAEVKASESRAGAKFEEIREQFVEINEQLRTTNERMTSIERQRDRLGWLLEGSREAQFARAANAIMRELGHRSRYNARRLNIQNLCLNRRATWS